MDFLFTTDKKEKSPIQEKWGDAVQSGKRGFLSIPDLLIMNQARLNLDTTDMVILLNILVHWWTVDELPHPRLSSIAKRIGVSTRTVERRVQKMQNMGLVERLPSEQKYTASGKFTVRKFKLTGLIKTLEKLA